MLVYARTMRWSHCHGIIVCKLKYYDDNYATYVCDTDEAWNKKSEKV